MSASLKRLNELIAETGERLDIQLLQIIAAESEGRDTKVARRVLKTLEGIFVEYQRAGEAAKESQGMVAAKRAKGGAVGGKGGQHDRQGHPPGRPP